MEDQEPYDEGHTVGGEVEALREQDLLQAVQPQDSCLVAGQLAGAGQRDAHTDGDGHERQRLLEQMRPSPPLPGPPADDVAHHGAGQPCARARNAGRDVEQLAHQVGQLRGAERQHRGGRKPGQPAAALGPEPALQRPGNDTPQAVSGCGQNRYSFGAFGHQCPRLTLARGSVSHGIQYENCGWPGHTDFPAISKRRLSRPHRMFGQGARS